MGSSSRRYGSGRLISLGCAVAALGGACVSPAQANSSWAPRLEAVYKLHLLGMEMATFKFTSTVTGDSYVLSGQTKMTWGLGLFKYTGSFAGAGKIAGDNVRPASYAYDWEVNKKGGGVRLGYGAGGVVKIDIAPPHEPGPDVVPLKPEHMRGVFDPLSSLIVLSRLRSGNPCDRKIAIFEGKQRFDLIFSPAREEKVAEKRVSGQPVTAHVCRVKYVPVAGHKISKETEGMVKAEGIEVAFRAVPEANLLIPFKITFPTRAGTAVLTAQKVDITAPGNRQIALMH